MGGYRTQGTHRHIHIVILNKTQFPCSIILQLQLDHMNLEDWCCVSFSSDTKSDQHTTGFRLPTSRSHRATESSPDLQSRYVHGPQVQKLFALYDGLAYYMSYMYTVHIFMYTRTLGNTRFLLQTAKKGALGWF